MSPDEVCEAGETLPDGTTNIDINNCGDYDIFMCKIGTPSIVSYQLFFKKYYTHNQQITPSCSNMRFRCLQRRVGGL